MVRGHGSRMLITLTFLFKQLIHHMKPIFGGFSFNLDIKKTNFNFSFSVLKFVAYY